MNFPEKIKKEGISFLFPGILKIVPKKKRNTYPPLLIIPSLPMRRWGDFCMGFVSRTVPAPLFPPSPLLSSLLPVFLLFLPLLFAFHVYLINRILVNDQFCFHRTSLPCKIPPLYPMPSRSSAAPAQAFSCRFGQERRSAAGNTYLSRFLHTLNRQKL